MNENISEKMKALFGWEIPVESVPIPSNGVLYDPDTPLFNKQMIQIKSMTAKEEDIITSNAYLKEGTMIRNLIQACVVDKSINVDDLISGDRDALLTSIRIVSYGSEYLVTHICKSCKSSNSLTVDLTSVGIKRLSIEPEESGKNLFKYELPKMKLPVLFRFLTGHDEHEQRQRSKNEQKLGLASKESSEITDYLNTCVVKVGENSKGSEIKFFVENMDAQDSKSLRQYIADNQPGLDMMHNYECDKCKREATVRLPFNENFFWPNP